jgi:hypothetical protein
MVDGMDGRARLGQKPDKFLGVVDDVVVGVRDKIRQAGTSLILWLETQGFVLGPFESVDWVRDFLVKSTYDVLADEYEVRNKYICAHLQSRLDIYRTGPPVPPILEGPSGSLDSHLLSGPAYRWFETRTREPTDRDDDSYRDRRLSILNSLTGLKKAQPEVSRTTVRKAVEKWGPALFEPRTTKEKPTVSDWDELEGVVVEIVGHLREKLHRAYVPIPIPSTKARLDSARKEGGALGAWIKEVESRLREVGPGGIWDGFSDGAPRADFSADTACLDPFWSFYPQVVLAADHEDGRSHVVVANVPWVPLLELLEHFATPLVVEPTGLPEPFKVRVISKGPTMPYWVCQVIQKAVHGALQDLPEFQLTRESPDRDIEDLLTGVLGTGLLSPNLFYVSGDYTGATDNLHPGVSNLVGHHLGSAMDLTPDLADLFLRALTGHVLVSSDGAERGQKWGQLMGSNVSFPVLCIANLALTIMALRRSEGTFSSPKRGVVAPRRFLGREVGRSGILINGDDIGFIASDVSYAEWSRVTSLFGLSPSVGKNFRSRDFIQLNSQMFRVSTVFDPLPLLGDLSDLPSGLAAQLAPVMVRPRRAWVRIPSASLAVLCPPRVVTASEFFLAAPSWQATFLSSTDGAEADRLNSIFLDVWSSFLKLLPTGLMNWFVPRLLGGFGLRPTRPFTMNEVQKHIAAFLRDNTSPESMRLSRLRWDSPDATTTTRSASDFILRRLESLGMIRWGLVNHESHAVDTTSLEQALILSGYGRPIPEHKSISLGDIHGWGLGPSLTAQWSAPSLGALPSATSGGVSGGSGEGPVGGPSPQGEGAPDVEPPPREPTPVEATSWFRSSVRLLRRAAKSTPRTMNEEDVAAWLSPTVGWVWAEGFVPRESHQIRVRVRDLRVAPPLPIADRLDTRQVQSLSTTGPLALLTLQPRPDVWDSDLGLAALYLEAEE